MSTRQGPFYLRSEMSSQALSTSGLGGPLYGLRTKDPLNLILRGSVSTRATSGAVDREFSAYLYIKVIYHVQ